ncbi:DUF4286 family protein [Spirosoma gilvum]
MILYNTTYSVASEIADDWVRWMKRFYLPAAIATELPVGHKILRLLTELDNGGTTFSVQLDFSSREDYETYLEQHADTLRQRIHHRFGSQFVSFDTLLQEE